MTTADDSLRPYELQVGGHSHTKAGVLPPSLLDAQGRFLKQLQDGERGAREAAFYACMQHHRQQQQQQEDLTIAQEPQLQPQLQQQEQQQQDEAAMSATVPGISPCDTCPDPQQHQLMQQLATWVPCSYGTREVGGHTYLVMEDLTAGFQQPCILDIKMGFRTWYPWASEAAQEKYRSKDESTTQSKLGFRLCGMVLQRHPGSSGSSGGSNGGSSGSSSGSNGGSSGAVERYDRHWGKGLTAEGVTDALRRYADIRPMTLHRLCEGPGGLLEQLKALAGVFEQQQCWHFYSASLLMVYKGAHSTAADAAAAGNAAAAAAAALAETAAATAADTPADNAAAPAVAAATTAASKVRVRLIDFAHSFPVQHPQQQQEPSQQQQQQQQRPIGRDQNFLDGLNSLIDTLLCALQLQHTPES